MGEREVCGVGYAECGVRLVCGGVHAVEHDVAGGVVSPAFFVTCELVVGLGFDLSMLEPPPMARRKSAPDLANASSPSFTFFTVGFCLISLNTSYGMPASSSTSSNPRDITEEDILELYKKAF